MRIKTTVLVLCLASLPAFLGCLGAFAANQGRRQAARTTDHYVKEYVTDDKETRNATADTIVRTGNKRQEAKGKVGVDDKGWLTKEDRN